MKKLFLITLLPILFSCSKAAGDNSGMSKKEINLNIATFNIRLSTTDDTGVRSWEARRSSVVAVIRDNDLDVVGFQEVLEDQQEDLKALLPEYSFYFVGRDDGTKGEAVGVAYRNSRFQPLNHLCFWLSPTPDTPSNASGWGGHPTRKRVAAVCRLIENSSHKQFYYLVTHMETGGSYAGARTKSAELILEREKLLNVNGLPFFVAGDMNTTYPDEESMEVLRTVFSDTFREADDKGVRQGPMGTFNGFDPEADLDNELVMLDYVFAKGDYTLNRYKVIDTRYDGQYPSDHLPIVINVTM